MCVVSFLYCRTWIWLSLAQLSYVLSLPLLLYTTSFQRLLYFYKRTAKKTTTTLKSKWIFCFCLFSDSRCVYFIFCFLLYFCHSSLTSCANLNYGTVHSSSWNWFVQHLIFTAHCSACKQTLITIYINIHNICAQFREIHTCREIETYCSARIVCFVHNRLQIKFHLSVRSFRRESSPRKNTLQYILDVI